MIEPKGVFPWKTLDSRIAYENPWIKVREDKIIDPLGEETIYGVLMTHPSIYIVALTDENEIVIIGHWRYPTHKYSWELPAGGSEGQDLLEAAQREFLEETGYKAREWEEIGIVQVMNGVSDEESHVFIARGLEQTGTNKQVADGIADMRAVPLPELREMIRSGEFNDGQSLAALMKATIHLGLLG